MKACGREKVQLFSFIAPVLDKDKWSASLINLFSREKSPYYTMNMGLTGFKSRSWRFGNKKSLLRLPGSENKFLVLPACSLVATPTEILHPYNNKMLVEIYESYVKKVPRSVLNIMK